MIANRVIIERSTKKLEAKVTDANGKKSYRDTLIKPEESKPNNYVEPIQGVAIEKLKCPNARERNQFTLTLIFLTRK